MPALTNFSKEFIIEKMVDSLRKTETHYESNIKNLKAIIEQARDDIFQVAVILKETSNATSVIGADLYERCRKTHELLRSTVETLEKEEGD